MLLDEGLQQAIQRAHDGGFTANFVGAVLLDQADAVLLDVARDDAGERTAQVGGQVMQRLLAGEVEACLLYTSPSPRDRG